MGLLTKNDSTLYRNWFKEMCRLRGISVGYQYATDTIKTIHSEFQSTYSDTISIDIIFDANPKVNTLKKLGWVSENSDDKPYIAYLPYDTVNLNTESIIVIPPSVENNTRSRKFKVTSITELIEYPDCWICTLAPVFDTETLNNDYSESNFNFIEEL